MDFEHTVECETRERPDECVQCWQAQPREYMPPKVQISFLWSYWHGIPVPPVQIVLRKHGRIVWMLDPHVGT